MSLIDFLSRHLATQSHYSYSHAV